MKDIEKSLFNYLSIVLLRFYRCNSTKIVKKKKNKEFPLSRQLILFRYSPAMLGSFTFWTDEFLFFMTKHMKTRLTY